MKVYLKLPEGPETAVNLNLIPKTGEKIEYGGIRYLVVSVIHAVESARTLLELVQVSAEDNFRNRRLSGDARYRTTEIRSYSPPSRSRSTRRAHTTVRSSVSPVRRSPNSGSSSSAW